MITAPIELPGQKKPMCCYFFKPSSKSNIGREFVAGHKINQNQKNCCADLNLQASDKVLKWLDRIQEEFTMVVAQARHEFCMQIEVAIFPSKENGKSINNQISPS